MKAAQLAGLSYMATHEEIAWITLIALELRMLELSYKSLVKICCQLRFAQICLNTIQEPQSEKTSRKKYKAEVEHPYQTRWHFQKCLYFLEVQLLLLCNPLKLHWSCASKTSEFFAGYSNQINRFI